MIKNARQYRITRSQAAKFRDALSQLDASPPGDTPPRLRQAIRDAIESQFLELEGQLAEYDALQRGEVTALEVDSLAAIPHALIAARIAAGLTQKELASRLGLAEQQIQQYEATDYASASVARVGEIAEALGVRLTGRVSLQGPSLARERAKR